MMYPYLKSLVVIEVELCTFWTSALAAAGSGERAPGYAGDWVIVGVILDMLVKRRSLP
jgi:hypothetical protein